MSFWLTVSPVGCRCSNARKSLVVVGVEEEAESFGLLIVLINLTRFGSFG